jgi:hypothetical protein
MNRLSGTGKELVQTGNRVGGSLAGRDVYDVKGDYHHHEAATPSESRLGALYRRLKVEAKGDAQLSDYIDQLAIYTRIVEDETIIGLDGKLNAASRSDQLEMAMAMKERVYAHIRRNLFSRTFQTIYAILMAKIWEEFTSYVRPAIARGAPRDEVDALINTRVIKPIAAELEDCAEYDGVASMEVRGMLYFLTGNCHLLWH